MSANERYYSQRSGVFRTLIARNFPLKLTKIFNLAKVFNYFKTVQGRTKQTETKSNGQNVITGKLSLCK